MGNQQGKPESDKDELAAVNILDLLATKYILTQNFQDLRKLSSPKYCNKLVILTKDVIKKYLTEKEITYAASRVEDGLPVPELTKEKVIYLDTNELKKRHSASPYDSNIRAPQPSMLTKLDVQNPATKDRLCKGIAKFYIKIAHLFSAIVKTINPIYKFTDKITGKVHEYSLMNKDLIPVPYSL